jgi:Flp pilus assembly protein TadB
LQRFEDFITERENKSSKFNRELLQFFAFLVVLSAISYFALNSPDIVAMAAASVVTLPIAFMLRNRLYAQDKRLLKELKESLQDQALDIST